MPRNITVTLADGSQHTYQNAPDDVTPEAVASRAQSEFGQSVTSLDGGRSAAPDPASATMAPSANLTSAPVAVTPPEDIAARVHSMVMDPNAKRADIEALAAQHPELNPRALKRVLDYRDTTGAYNAPVVTQGGPPVPVADKPAQAGAELAARDATNPGAQALAAGLTAATGQSVSPEDLNAFAGAVRTTAGGIPEALAAAGERFLPSSITGNTSNATFSQILDTIRARDAGDMAQSTAGNVVGQVTGGVAGGKLLGGIVGAASKGLAGAASPAAASVGNVLQRLGTLAEADPAVNGGALSIADKAANLGKIAAAGGSFGAVQAAGTGEDPIEGGLVGAAAGPLLHGAGATILKGIPAAGRFATRAFSTNIGKALRETVTENPEAIQARMLALADRTGAPVPAVAALNDQDFKNVADKLIKRSPQAAQIAKSQSATYVRGFMDRMLAHVNRAGADGDAQQTVLGDLADARKNTADDLMAPIADRNVDMSQLPLSDLERQVTRQMGGRITGLGNRINTALADLPPDDLAPDGISGEDYANARRLMQQYGLGNPVNGTVRELDGLRRTLNSAGSRLSASNPVDGRAMTNAAKIIADHVGSEVPGYSEMVDTYAAHSRMIDGFKTAAAGTRTSDVEDDLLRSNLRTREGLVGMKAGELYRLREAATAKPTSAITLARDAASQGQLTRPASLDPGAAQPGTVTENIGEAPAARLADASDAETSVLNRMVDTGQVNTLAKDEKGTLSAADIVHAAFLHGALPGTKIRTGMNLINKLSPGFDRGTAAKVTEMLYSADPADQEKSFRALGRVGMSKQIVTGIMRQSLPAAAIGAAGAVNVGRAMGSATPEAPVDATGGDPTAMPADLAEGSSPSGSSGPGTPAGDPTAMPADLAAPSNTYSAHLSSIYQSKNPELLAMADRVAQAETNGNHFDKRGNPKISRAGAVGLMQIEPSTAPQAAREAGLPMDRDALYHDPSYNKALGIGHLTSLLRHYKGSAIKSAAAYNVGQGRVDKELAKGGDWISRLPIETQNYIRKVV